MHTVKMQWNISTVEKNLDTLTINGFRENSKCEYMKCKITKTNLKDALQNYNGDYHEGYGLSIVNPDLVYIIDVTFYPSIINECLMKNKPYVSAEEVKYFDGEYYMGLPTTTFLLWKSMINTDL